MLKTLEPQDFDVELQSNREPFVVAFLKKNERFRNQSQALDEVSRHYDGKIRCYLYDTDYLDTAMDRFMVKGTPTFLLFSEGKEVDRLIGESDQETLDEFIGNFMLSR
ncbi:thioredoxin family protein [Pseudodesulfovibrio sp. zrk46]|uniref:thioredoxin family protein n=1 Tax=Pseudodesulfovibrio sp. zrk46 TaxID=2725288 RepID=UPI001448BC0E|nr:thioredoxin family protein [Pseudodesulfovibrio sp. zrk46]QJB54988.1 thioredoxin family protein [Pseudodesulfovibrio sp. zrk46]